MITVAIPVRNGGALFVEVLEAVAAQELADEVEVLVCDSGSTDGSAAAARARGATVIAIEPASYSHGGTRNMLAERAQGDHVAFLTHDAVPASPRWLAALLSAFADEDVGLACGSYVPRPDASLPVRRELREWFAQLGETTTVDRLAPHERDVEPWTLGPRRTFFTDANGAIAKAAWREVPFRDVAYAEDRQLAIDMLRAGYAKAYVPEAAVVHSHDYAPRELLRRSFDEWRGLHETTGLTEPITLNAFRGHVTSRVRLDVREGAGILTSVTHHGSRWIGALLGSRADRLPAALRRRLSLEARA